MYIPAVISQLEDAIPNLSGQAPIFIEFPKPEGGFIKLSMSGSDQLAIELSGNENLYVPFSEEAINFLENSMGWKLNSKTSNFQLEISNRTSLDELLGIVLLSLECSFTDHVREVSDPDYWPNFEEAQEMQRRSFGRKHQAVIEGRLAE